MKNRLKHFTPFFDCAVFDGQYHTLNLFFENKSVILKINTCTLQQNKPKIYDCMDLVTRMNSPINHKTMATSLKKWCLHISLHSGNRAPLI